MQKKKEIMILTNPIQIPFEKFNVRTSELVQKAMDDKTHLTG